MKISSITRLARPFGGDAGPYPLILDATIAALKASPYVARRVGDRVFPDVIPQGTTLPAIAVQQLTHTSTRTLRGPAGLTRATFQISATARTRVESQDAIEAVRQAIDGELNAVWSRLRVREVERIDDAHTYEAPVDASDRGLRRVAADYAVRYYEPRPGRLGLTPA